MRDSRIRAVAAFVALLVAACSVETVTPAPESTSTPAPTVAAIAGETSPPGSPAPIALGEEFRPEGPWEVDFLAPGQPLVREVFVLTPTCPAGPCDVKVVIQDFSGNRLGTGVFRHADGVYALELERRTTEACALSAELVSEGVEQVATTTLVLAGHRPAGSAVVSPRIQGERSIVTRPLDARACPASETTYAALGQPTRFARAQPTPGPTPKPTSIPKAPKVTVIRPSFFGPGVSISTFRVRGDTPYEISRSINREGPYSRWLDGSAAGLTKMRAAYRWHVETDPYGGCRIVREAKPAIKLSYTIVLPRWKAPTGVSSGTIQWWNDDVRGIAKHERVHVEIYRDAQQRLNSTLASSTCANVKRRLDRVWNATQREQCEFDMREYGTEMGLSMKACLAG